MTNTLPNDWPFAEHPNVAIFTTSDILARESPILHVSHDADDGGWQFHSGTDIDLDRAKVISLKEIVKLDRSLLELADLPLGWKAVRSSQHDVWQYSKLPTEATG
jgi:hypothetical protein